MKVCVINFSGNVGKTTVAANLLAPRVDGATLYSVESLNQDAEGDGVEVQRLRAQRFGELQRDVLLQPAVIVDVGSSNAEVFMGMMAQYEGSHEDYDFFVVPTVKDRKQAGDTVNTITALRRLGVEPDRIRVVFNKVEVEDVLEDVFAPIYGLATLGEFQLRPKAAIYTNEVFELIKDTGHTLASVVADSTDHREAIRQAESDEARSAAASRLAIKRLSGSCSKNLDATFAALFAA